MSLISYVIPVYNNAGSLVPTWEAIRALFDGPLAAHKCEVIFINDGSKDASLEEIRGLAAADSRVLALSFTRNFGQLSAMLAGYRQARGDAIINMSADLQDPVELTAEMVSKWHAGCEVVVGYRQEREDSLPARLFSKLAYAAVRAGNRNVPAGGFDFVLMSRSALDVFLSLKGRNRFFQGDVLWAGFPTAFLPYVRRRRAVGKSQYTFSKKLKLFFDFALDSSYLPIRAMSFCGALLAFLGVLYAALIIGSWAFNRTPFTGWAPIMVVLLMTTGALMLMLGIIGEYVWRILDEIKDKPMYVIDTAATKTPSADTQESSEQAR